MRIVSQDRNVSIDLDKVIIKILNENHIYADSYSAYKSLIFLGCYDSPKRAQEVFDDIHKAYAPVYSISDNLSEEQIKALIPSKNVYANNIVNIESDTSLTTYDNYIYYMPKE